MPLALNLKQLTMIKLVNKFVARSISTKERSQKLALLVTDYKRHHTKRATKIMENKFKSPKYIPKYAIF